MVVALSAIAKSISINGSHRASCGSERSTIEAQSYRRARYWLTGLAIKTRAVKLREYIGKITEADIAFLRRDANIAEAVSDLRKLSSELLAFADALNLDAEELQLLADARTRIEE